jgi:hypothetical protein
LGFNIGASRIIRASCLCTTGMGDRAMSPSWDYRSVSSSHLSHINVDTKCSPDLKRKIHHDTSDGPAHLLRSVRPLLALLSRFSKH